MPFARVLAVLALPLVAGAPIAATAAEPVDAYRRAYVAECRASGTEAYCSCMAAATAVEALALKTGPYKMLALADRDAIEALMLDVNREISSRINNRVPVSTTQSQDVMGYALGKHAIAVDVDTMIRLNDDAFARSALTCDGENKPASP